MKKRIILFGSGAIGKEALEYFGADNIECFCDNNANLKGLEKCGKKIIAYTELKKFYHENILIISMNDINALSVAEQLEEDNIKDFLVYEDIKRFGFDKETRDVWISQLANYDVRVQIKSEFYRRQLNIKREQYDYLKEHVDITTLKPTTGYLRGRQKATLEFAIEFFEYIKPLNIRPFLVAGSLIGAVRHNGFIPWDDDLDFGLMRSDYEKLITFCQENMHVELYDGEWSSYTSDIHIGRMNDLEKKYTNEYILGIYIDQIQITRGTSCVDRLAIDFFCFDYYREGYMMEEHLDYLQMLLDKRKEINNIKEIVYYLRNEIAINPNISTEETNFIFPSIDSLLGYFSIDKSPAWIESKNFFPLKLIEFENKEFLVPSNCNNILKLWYKNYMSFPLDLGIPSHLSYIEKYMTSYMPTVEFFVSHSSELEIFTELYKEFNKNGIYSEFVIEPYRANRKEYCRDYETAEKRLKTLEVRYRKKRNTECDCLITMNGDYNMPRYGKDTICITNISIKNIPEMINRIHNITTKKKNC